MKGPGRSRTWAGLLYLPITWLCFPQLLLGQPLDGGLLFAWLSPLLLLLALRGLAWRAALRRAFVLGVLSQASLLYWIYVVTVQYGHAPAWLGVLTPFALGLYGALFFALFGALSRPFLRLGPALRAPALAALYVALEHARSFVFGGFPLHLLGYAQHENPLLMGLAPYAGVYGLSFAVTLPAALLYDAFESGGEAAGTAQVSAAARGEASGAAPAASRPAWLRPVAAAALALLFFHALGFALQTPRVSGERLRVAALQGNVPQGVKWSPQWAERILAGYEELARQSALRGAQLIVWPEAAAPGSLEDAGLAGRFAGLARETGAHLLVGATAVEAEASGSGAYRVYDSAYLFTPEGAVQDRYDKARLVPFGEYLPLRGLLGAWLTPLARGIAGRDLSAGEGPRGMAAPGLEPGTDAPLRLAVPICYELFFPDLVRRMSQDGARLLLGITNDAWYGRSAASYQFLAMAALRAAESGVWLVRVAGTGVSAVIDERGAVRESSGLFEREALVFDVPLAGAGRAPTFYARHGDGFAALCWATALVFGALTYWRPARQRRAGEAR